MALDISDADVLTRFDMLVENGIIFYGPTNAIPLLDKDFPFEFRICPTWSKKPMMIDAALPTEKEQEEPEKFGPGSDIYKSHPNQVIGTINDTHVLALNIYPVFRPQYLLLTLNSYRSQNEPLDLQDIEATWAFLQSAQSPHCALYNCTQEASCSRNHKHLQFLKKPMTAGRNKTCFQFFPDVKDQEIQVPYMYFIYYFDSLGHGEPIDAKTVFNIYMDLLQKCRKALGISVDDSLSLCPHNVFIVKEWIVVTPRRRGSFEGMSGNALAMMGMSTIVTMNQFETWKAIGPSKILGELGVSSGSVI